MRSNVQLMLLLHFALAQDSLNPWAQWLINVEPINPCYTYQAETVANKELHKQATEAINLMKNNPQAGSMILCPCLGDLSSITAETSEKQPILDNMNSNDKQINDRFVEAFITSGDQNKQKSATMARYNFKPDQLNYWAFFFAFKESLAKYSGGKPMQRYIGGEFLFSQTVFDENLLIPAIQDPSFVNASNLNRKHSRLGLGVLQDSDVDKIWISQSVGLCYDLLITGLAYVHSPDDPGITPPTPAPPTDSALDPSYFTWTDECTSADCGYPNLVDEKAVCPGPRCTWCKHWSGITGPMSINHTFPIPSDGRTDGWELSPDIAWGELNGPAAELNARMFCENMMECTGYYWGAAGGCISISQDPILQRTSTYSRQQKNGGQAYNILPHTFYKFMRKGTYREDNVALNMNSASNITLKNIETQIFTDSSCDNDQCTSETPGYRPFHGYKIEQKPLEIQSQSTLQKCAAFCDKADRCMAFSFNEGTCHIFDTDHTLPSAADITYKKSTFISTQHPTLEACQTSCKLMADCMACVETDGDDKLYHTIGVGGEVKNAVKKWTRVGTDSAGFCRQACWADEKCLAWTWEDKYCNHAMDFGDVAFGIKPNMPVIRELGFSDTIKCEKPGHLFDLCSQTCVDLQNHLEAGWCNNNWVNCQDGPFKTASGTPGAHLCTGSTLYLDDKTSTMKAHIPSDTNDHVKNPDLAAGINVNINVQYYGLRQINGAFEANDVTKCAIGTGIKTFNAKDLRGNPVDNVQVDDNALNFIAQPSHKGTEESPFRTAWGTNQSLVDCGETGCRFGTCVLHAPQQVMQSYITDSEDPSEEQFSGDVSDKIYQIEKLIQFNCTPGAFMNVLPGPSSKRAFSFSALNPEAAGNGACCGLPWNINCTDANDCCPTQKQTYLKQQQISCSQGLYNANTRPMSPRHTDDTTYYLNVDDMDLLPPKTCQGPLDASLSVSDLKKAKILTDEDLPIASTKGNAGVKRKDALDLQFMCPLGVTRGKDPDNSAPFEVRVKNSLAQLTLKCPYNKKFKRAKITPMTINANGRCRYGALTDDLFAVPTWNSTKYQYNYSPLESPWIGAAMQYAAKCTRYDFECLDTMPDDQQICGIASDGACGLSDDGRFAQTAQDVLQKCSQIPMEICPLPGYTVQWTNDVLTCVPNGATGLYHTDTNTKGIKFWPGFVTKENSNAGIGPGWFDKHDSCNQTTKCGGIGDCGPVLEKDNDLIKTIEMCQKNLTQMCCNQQAWHDPIAISQTGQCTLDACIAKPTMQCLGAQWDTCASQTGTCSALEPSCCVCKPQCLDTKQSQKIQLVSIGQSKGNVCGTAKTYVAQSVAWGNGTGNVLSCNGEAEMTAGALWRDNSPPCGCKLQLESNFRLVRNDSTQLRINNTQTGQVECYFTCDKDAQCYGCAQHTDGTWHTATPDGNTNLLGYTMYKKTFTNPACCDAQKSCAYERADDGKCPPHADGCGRGGSVCETEECTKCVCICEDLFTGPYCDQCKDPHKDIASECTSCVGNYIKDINGDCTICKPGFTISSGCTECTEFYAPDRTGACEVPLCGIIPGQTEISHGGVFVAYNTKTNKQMFDGTKGIPQQVIPLGVQYSIIVNAANADQSVFWLTKTHKHKVVNIGQMPFYRYRLDASQQEWFRTIPIGENVTRAQIIQDMTITGYVCPDENIVQGTASTTVTAELCALSCAKIQQCVAWRWSNESNACQIIQDTVSQSSSFSFGALKQKYACHSGGIIGASDKRDRMPLQDAYFSNEDNVEVTYFRGKIVTTFNDPATMYYIDQNLKYKLPTKCGTENSFTTMTRACGTKRNHWTPIVVRDDWFNTIFSANSKLPPIDICDASFETTETFQNICSPPESDNIDNLALQMPPSHTVVDNNRAIHSENVESLTECCKLCNAMADERDANSLRFWSYKNTLCKCYDSDQSQLVPFMRNTRDTTVISQCDQSTSATGQLYVKWDKQKYPNGCNPRVFMTDPYSHVHGHCLDTSQCAPINVTNESPVELFFCQNMCINNFRCTSVEWNNNTKECNLFECELAHKWPQKCDTGTSRLVSVKTGGCVPGKLGEHDICMQRKLTGEYVGAITKNTCTAYGDDVSAFIVDASVQFPTEGQVTVQAEYECKAKPQDAIWTTLPLFPTNTKPLIISDLTDALYYNMELQKQGTRILTGIPDRFKVPQAKQVLDMQPYNGPSSSVFTVFFSRLFDAEFLMSQFIPHAEPSSLSTSSCLQQAELQIQQASENKDSQTHCTGEVCVKTEQNIDQYINHYLNELESLQEACHVQQKKAHLHQALPAFFVTETDPTTWTYDKYHQAFVPKLLLNQQQNMGPAPTPAPGARTPSPTPSPTPFGTASPTPKPGPHVNVISLDDVCVLSQTANSTINVNLNWPHRYLPKILARTNGKCKPCAELCYDNPLCSMMSCQAQDKVGQCIMYSLALDSVDNPNTRDKAFVQEPNLECKITNVKYALVHSATTDVYVKNDCCI
tara:strand:- start:10248 stop:17681 length:7434 start_codon:yes stop_codon:yes gene_type:complete